MTDIHSGHTPESGGHDLPTIRSAPAQKARKLTTMRLSGELMKQIAARAKQEGRSRSNLVEVLLTSALKKRTAEKTDGTVFG
jgi:hypothetical protein